MVSTLIGDGLGIPSVGDILLSILPESEFSAITTSKKKIDSTLPYNSFTIQNLYSYFCLCGILLPIFKFFPKIYFIQCFYETISEETALINCKDSFKCHSPRKSLVKGERFIRVEERLEIKEGSRCEPGPMGDSLHEAETSLHVTSISGKDVGLLRKSQFPQYNL